MSHMLNFTYKFDEYDPIEGRTLTYSERESGTFIADRQLIVGTHLYVVDNTTIEQRVGHDFAYFPCITSTCSDN
jgi:hypothetical protein